MAGTPVYLAASAKKRGVLKAFRNRLWEARDWAVAT